MEPRYSSAAYRVDLHGRRTSRWRFTPGIASEFICELSTLLEREGRRPIVLYCRVSSDEQERAGNLNDQMADAIRQLYTMGFRLGRDLCVIDAVESSRIEDARTWLESAITEAREKGAIVVAVSRDRFLRWRHIERGCQHEPPTIAEYVELKQLAGNVPLATISPPDDPAVRGHQIKRGQNAKGRKGGRPRKPKPRREWKKRREKRIALARQLYDAGMSFREIADRLNKLEDGFGNQNHATVRNWLKRGV